MRSPISGIFLPIVKAGACAGSKKSCRQRKYSYCFLSQQK
ncbi:hypothetical protein RNAN_1087 [Rheinheimera nanhaiensis E407-8]|uniref:Uncharacterized protein n=1 Tax=Rheinheimera nanhaiensis E407-8 TaxID=562729 RepID=I1DVN8_9GAMM|nr:hypothetical protein RNAN_1087 [Rheinheimera nanhaiensis E407-8]